MEHILKTDTIKTNTTTLKTEGIEVCRFLSALWTVAVFTSPLASISPGIDFFFTGILGKAAVPFFLVAAGYTILPKSMEETAGKNQFFRFIGSQVCIYILATMLYLPSYLKNGWTDLSLIRDLFWRGVACNLWYYPALITGMLLTRILLKYLPGYLVNTAVILLYIIGFIKDSFDFLLQSGSSGNSQNALLYAPLFLVLGYQVSRGAKLKGNKAVLGLVLSLFVMTAEGFLLHFYGVHSLYLSLPLVLYFLFQYTQQWECKVRWQAGQLPELIYLLSPFSIALVKWITKESGTDILVGNSVVYFYFVLMITIFTAFLIQLLIIRYKRESFYLES